MSLVTRGLGRLGQYVGRGLGPRRRFVFVPIGHKALEVGGPTDSANLNVNLSLAAVAVLDTRTERQVGDETAGREDDHRIEDDHTGRTVSGRDNEQDILE